MVTFFIICGLVACAIGVYLREFFIVFCAVMLTLVTLITASSMQFEKIENIFNAGCIEVGGKPAKIIYSTDNIPVFGCFKADKLEYVKNYDELLDDLRLKNN